MIFEAGFVSLFRTIFVLALLYYGIRFFFRYLYPYITKSFFNKSQNNSFRSSSKGEAKKNPSDTLGEYVDYEEVKEEDPKQD